MGGEVAKEFNREHEGAMRHGAKTRKYHKSFDHYYEEGEAGFADGGMTPGMPKMHGLKSFLHPGMRGKRNLSKGGEAKESFKSFLAKRQMAR